ncbi:DUF3300 domain-containing protein [Bordetella hinzii]|uniref:DUF3300 domain-containing protein n=1 Tax=Bordetella hinzii TaxID=103855 RepID=UPI003F1A2F76
MRARSGLLAGLWVLCLIAAPPAAWAQAAPASQASSAKLDRAQLDQLLAPIALYPDALLSQILMAATYPADVAAAAAWSAQHTSLSGDAAVKAVQDQGWDPSVKSLAAFPSVLDMMGRQPQWVASVGDAFLAQPDDVMNSAQRLRAQAKQAGTLKSTPQQTVSTQPGPNNTTVISIAPANPQVVYVPTYNPTVVYGTWPYPAYPPAYYPPPPGSVFATALVSGIGFGLGVAAVDALWGGMNWGHYDVDINVNRYNNINPGHRMPPPPPNANGRANWQHNPANRGNVPYHNPDVAQRFDAARQAGRPGGAAPAGRPAMQGRDAERERAAQAFQNRTGQSIPGHAVPGQRPGQGGAGPQHIGQGGQARAHDGGFSPRAGQPQLSPDQRQRLDQRNAQHHAEAMNRSSAFRGAGNGEAMRGQLERGGAAQSSFHTQRGGAHFGRGRR